MTAYFTICSNNYLAQAIVLGQSVNRHIPSSTFTIVLADLKSDAIDYSTIPFEVLPIGSIEPRTSELGQKYNIIEFNTCVKPRVIEYLLIERGADRVIYLDPDTRVYSTFGEVEALLDDVNVVLTPHAYTPIPVDGKGPSDNIFLRYGVYNLGFIAVRRSDETLKLVRWWKDRTYVSGYSRPEIGQFVDQLYINLAPIMFDGVSLLRHEGYNMAPWNFHERALSLVDGVYRVNETLQLVLFHFSSFKVDSGELPIHSYNRYTMKDRPDLVELYANYNQELKAADHSRYARVRWAFARPEPKVGLLGVAKNRARTALRDGVTRWVNKLPTPLSDGFYHLIKRPGPNQSTR